MTQHWHLSPTHSKSQLLHILNTEVIWLNTHSTTALDTAMQTQDTAYAICFSWRVVCAVGMPIVLLMEKLLWLFSVANAKTKTQLKLICEIFIMCIRFSKISLFRMVLKRFKWHQVFSGVARNVSYTPAWVSEEGQEFENIRKKLFSSFRVVKNKFTTFGSPRTTLGKIH